VVDTGRPSVATLLNMIVMQLEVAGDLPLKIKTASDPTPSSMD
jgi:shikimate kinase